MSSALLSRPFVADISDDTFGSAASQESSKSATRVSALLAEETNIQNELAFPETSTKFQARNRLKSISVEKLKFNKVALHGRGKETELLDSTFMQVCDPLQGNDRSLTLIAGFSGTGKSALAAHLKKVVMAKHGLYARGKFDISERREPLSAITMAINAIACDVLALKDRALFDKIKNLMNVKLRSELSLLVRIIPRITEFQDPTSGGPMLDDFKGATDRFKFVFRKFVRIITTFVPVVILFDDLQWSDPESITLIKILITDSQTKALMIIGCYRSNLVDNDHDLSKMYHEIESCAIERNINVQTIHLNELSVEAVSDYLADLLSTYPRYTAGLASILVKKTGGNVVSLQQFLISLAKQELLGYNVGLDKWVWDDQRIQAESIAMESVANLMKDRLKEVEVAARILPIAACLGSQFSTRLLSVIMNHFTTADTMVGSRDSSLLSSSSAFISKAFSMVSDDLIDELCICEDEGFIEVRAFANYSFVHDKVQEAALDLLPDDEPVKFRIGEILWRSLDEFEVEQHLFEVVGLLNSRLDLVPDEVHYKLEVGRLHYRAGRKAVSISAFRSASHFFTDAMTLLPEEAWQDDLLFCIDLYSSAAETEFCLGNFEKVVTYATKVTLLTTCQPVDKLRLYSVLLESYAVWDKNLMAIDVGIEVLSLLGCPFPKTKLAIISQTVRGLLKTKRSVKRVTPEFIDALPVTNDPVHIGIMQILSSMVYPCYGAKPEMIVIICLYMSKYTIKHGITPYAPVAFSFLGWLLSHFLSDFEGGKVYAGHAFRLLKKHDCTIVEARALFMINSGVWHWTNSLQSVMPQFIHIYDRAMRAGKSEDGLLSIYYYLEAAMYTGRELESIENDLGTFMNQMVDFNQSKLLFFSKCLLQTVRNLRGKSATTSVLTGGVMDEEETMKICTEKNDKYMLAHVVRRKMFLACHFAEHDVNAELGLTHGAALFKTLIGQTSIPVLAFILSLSSFAMARQSKKESKYKRQALKYRKMIHKWSSHNPQCLLYLKVLDAENAAVGGKSEDAVKWYQDAATMTGRTGAIHEQALIHERMAELYLEIGKPNEAKYRLEKAIELYSEWKAAKKVRHLERRLQALVFKQGDDSEHIGPPGVEIHSSCSR